MTCSNTSHNVSRILAALCLGAIALAGCSPSGDRQPGAEATQASEVWHDYPFKSHYQEVLGSNLHYIDEGDPDGQVFLFLHGNPTSSYLWRNIVPIVAQSGRAIAVDNIGFGMSDQPDLDYTFVEHAEYIGGFIDALGLKDVILVIHDWGSGLGFDYAARHPDNVKGIVFMESILGVGSIEDLPEEMRDVFSLFRTPVAGWFLVQVQNAFIDQGLQQSVIRTLSEEEMDAYREPFATWGSRKPILVWPRQIPFDGEPADVAARVKAYSDWVPSSAMPKLHLYVDPGTIGSPAIAKAMEDEWENLDSKFLGKGGHFLQEDHAEAIGNAIVAWQAKHFGAAEAIQPN